MTKGVSIQPLTEADYDAWLPLWTANNQGQVAADVTAATWGRLMEKDGQVRGLAAWANGRETMAGFVHYILHPVTGHLRPACYMQDLFVNPQQRKQGIGRTLVIDLAARAKAASYARLYWLAEANNEAAQALYETLGFRLDFTFHVLPL